MAGILGRNTVKELGPLRGIQVLALCAAATCAALSAWAGEMRKIDVPLGLAGQMAFLAVVDGVWQVWVMDCPTGNCRQVTTCALDKRAPGWSPDGDLIYRTTNGKIERVELDSGETTAIAPTVGFLVDPALSPSGDRLAFARFENEPVDNTDVFIHEFKTGKLTRIADSPDLDRAPAWSPDGKRIAFIIGRGRANHLLHLMNADGTKKVKLQEEPSTDASPTWSPDGRWIAFTSSRSGDNEIWRVSPDGKPIEQLTNAPGQDTQPCYSPDGRFIVFVSNREASLALWLMDADGSNPRALTPKDWPVSAPAWWNEPPPPTKPPETKDGAAPAAAKEVKP